MCTQADHKLYLLAVIEKEVDNARVYRPVSLAAWRIPTIVCLCVCVWTIITVSDVGCGIELVCPYLAFTTLIFGLKFTFLRHQINSMLKMNIGIQVTENSRPPTKALIPTQQPCVMLEGCLSVRQQRLLNHTYLLLPERSPSPCILAFVFCFFLPVGCVRKQTKLDLLFARSYWKGGW
jgi:hypothetical protein